MNAEGFYILKTSVREIRCYRCKACTEYRDVPLSGTLWCCGKQIPIPKDIKRVVEYRSPAPGSVDLSQPTRVGDSYVGIVD
jgi:hypothetical protein